MDFSASDGTEKILEEMYHSMKKKFHELKNLRMKSVEEDIQEIKQRIEEHIEVHADAVRELETQNGKLKEAIKNRTAYSDRREHLESRVFELREDLKRKEPVFEPFLEENSGFSIRVLDRRVYEVSYGDLVTMKLSRKHNDLTCTFVSYHPSLAKTKETSFISSPGCSLAFTMDQLKKFVRSIKIGIQNCK